MQYDWIEIHFRTKENEPRMVIIDRDSQVGLIRLEDVVADTPPRVPVARGLHIVGAVAPEDGPLVCYKTPTGLVCW